MPRGGSQEDEGQCVFTKLLNIYCVFHYWHVTEAESQGPVKPPSHQRMSEKVCAPSWRLKVTCVPPLHLAPASGTWTAHRCPLVPRAASTAAVGSRPSWLCLSFPADPPGSLSPAPGAGRWSQETPGMFLSVHREIKELDRTASA